MYLSKYLSLGEEEEKDESSSSFSSSGLYDPQQNSTGSTTWTTVHLLLLGVFPPSPPQVFMIHSKIALEAQHGHKYNTSSSFSSWSL